MTITESPETVIVGHQSLLTRAVSNLIDNAVKFSPEGSPVEISVSGGSVAVRDHGPGIAPSERELVFDRFFRSIETSVAPGSGLGLAIVSDIVAAHNGETFVEDPDDGGRGVVVGFGVRGV